MQRENSLENKQWKSIYKLAAIAGITVAVLIPVQGAIFALWPPPQSVPEWFALFQHSKLIGLLDMDLLLTFDYLLFIVIFFALWGALKHANYPLASIAFIFEIVGIAAYLASAAAFEMLGLSKLYQSATSEDQRNNILAAGQAMYASWQGTAFTVSYILGCIALITISVVMLKSNVFSKPISYLGLAAGILMVVPPTVGPVGFIMSFLSLIPTLPWLILISRKFLNLSRDPVPRSYVESNVTLQDTGA
jgi:hypothetical protein